jgi:hypothetical protein
LRDAARLIQQFTSRRERRIIRQLSGAPLPGFKFAQFL